MSGESVFPARFHDACSGNVVGVAKLHGKRGDSFPPCDQVPRNIPGGFSRSVRAINFDGSQYVHQR